MDLDRPSDGTSNHSMTDPTPTAEMPDATPWTRVGKATPGGQYLRRFWQPACRSVDLAKGRAMRSRLLGETLTLYRGESGRAHAVGERCPHRGTLLSLGWVEKDQLRCHHHGWRFDGGGLCTEIPGEGAALCERVRVASYPVAEYLGLVFAYLGEGDAPPLPRFPDFEGSGVLRLPAPELWPCSYFERIQNSHDVMHVAFTHIASGVSDLFTKVPEVEVEETEFGIRTRMSIPGTKDPLPPVLLYMPNALVFQTPVDDRVGWRDHLVWRVPVDDSVCASYSLALIPTELADADHRFDRSVPYPLQPGTTARDGERVIAGEAHLGNGDWPHLTELEDYVALVGLPQTGQAFPEKLVRRDAHLSILRDVFRREIDALQKGAALTGWSHLGSARQGDGGTDAD